MANFNYKFNCYGCNKQCYRCKKIRDCKTYDQAVNKALGIKKVESGTCQKRKIEQEARRLTKLIIENYNRMKEEDQHDIAENLISQDSIEYALEEHLTTHRNYWKIRVAVVKNIHEEGYVIIK